TLTDNQFLTLRYDFENNDRYEDGLEILGATSAASAGGIQHNELWSALLNHTWIASQMALNEAVFQASYFDNTIENIHDDPRLHFPHLVRGSYGSAQETIQKKYQWKDDFSYHSGHHDWKAGVDWIHSPELFVNNPFLSAGSFYYSVDDADAAPFAFFSTYGDARARRPNDQVGIYIQDDWTIGERLVLNLGLRYDVEFGTFDVPETLIGRAIEDNPAARREAGFERGTLKNDVDNIGPRLGFAWDARGDGKTVVRGGTGIFYDQIFFSITLFDDLLTNDPPFVGVLIFSPTFGPGNIPDLSEYATPANAFPYFTSPDLQTPYSVQRSLGISQQIGEHLAVDADAVLVRGVHEFRQRRINIDPDGDGPLPRPISEEFGTVNLSETTGESWYRALHLALRGRWGKASLQISATIADAETHQGDFGYAPQNNLHDNAPDHTRRDIGKPVNFEPWRLVASGIYELPAGFQVSGIVQAAHARPYTTSYGYDLNGDGVSNDRPDGLGDRYGDPFFMADLRVSKFFRFGHGPNVEASVDVFNVFDTVNFGSSYDGSLYSGSPDNPNPTYGKPTATFGPPRQIQLGLRINF
ncbi:MAG: TonB-dependent receptor, partial [Acidobacteriota bacterium]